MRNFNYEKKYHYLIKYIIIGLPILLLLVSNFSYNNYFSDMKQELYNLFVAFRQLNINQWYDNILNTINFNITNETGYIILSMPLYIFWVYVLDLVLDIFVFVPKLAHKLMYKLGGN